MSTVFAQLLPELVGPIGSALRGGGHVSQAASLANSEVARWTYDPSVEAGYIYLVQRKPVHHSETGVDETIAFMFEPCWFNVDLRSHGEIFGIELLSHASIFERLSTMPNDDVASSAPDDMPNPPFQRTATRPLN